MTQGGRQDDNLSDVWERLEHEFQQRPAPPTPGGPYRAPEEPAGRPEPPRSAPRRMSFSLVQTRPRAVYVLLAANVVMYGVTWFIAQRVGTAVIDGQQIDGFTYALLVLGAKFNPLIDAGQWWRLLTPMVLHGSMLHLLFNTYALYVLGPQVESTFGTARFLAVYLVSGLAGSVASYVWNADALSVGASGAIFGLFGALGAFAYSSRSLIGWEASRMQLYQMATLVAINLVFGLHYAQYRQFGAHRRPGRRWVRRYGLSSALCNRPLQYAAVAGASRQSAAGVGRYGRAAAGDRSLVYVCDGCGVKLCSTQPRPNRTTRCWRWWWHCRSSGW